MSDLSAVPFEAQSLPEQLSVSFLDDAQSFLGGFLFTALMTVFGAALVTVALVVGVVGSPIIAALLAYMIYGSKRGARPTAPRRSDRTSS